MKKNKPLTEEQIQYIKDNYNKLSVNKMYQHLKIDERRVTRYLKENNMFGFGPHHYAWTDADTEFLKANVEKFTIKQIAKLMKKSTVTVSKKIKELGYTDLIKQRTLNSYYKKGAVSFNKGKKLTDYASPEAIEKMKIGRFKKGRLPHNTKEIGYESIRKDSNGRKYIFIKTEKGMRLKQVVIWEQVNGKIPKGHKLVFKDGNSLNCKIENLELLTNAVLMERNSLHNYPKEIKELIYIKSKITRKINDYEQNRKTT